MDSCKCMQLVAAENRDRNQVLGYPLVAQLLSQFMRDLRVVELRFKIDFDMNTVK